MQQRQRIAMQRALAEEALGKFRSARHLFGVESSASGDDRRDLDAWVLKEESCA